MFLGTLIHLGRRGCAVLQHHLQDSLEVINRLYFDGCGVVGSCCLINFDWRVLIQEIKAPHTVELKTSDEELVLVPFGLHRSKHLCDNFGEDSPLGLCFFVDLGFLLSENGMSLASACLTIA